MPLCINHCLACEQAPSKGGKKFGERASGSQSVVTPRAKRVGRGLRTPSSPDRSRLIPFAPDCTQTVLSYLQREPVRRLTTVSQSNASISMCNEWTNDTQSSRKKHFIMSIYAVCFSVIKSCAYWDSSTLQALHEHACLVYEKCNVDRVGKMPSNITVWSDLKSFLSLIVNYVSISLHRRGGRGARD